MKQPIIYLLLALSFVLPLACGGSDTEQSKAARIKQELGLPEWAFGPLRTAPMQIGDVTAEVELAFGQEEQSQGLMFRKTMPENHGMLFVYAKSQFLSFWMKNTLLPLSIAFIREDGTIDVIRDMKPLDTNPRYNSKHKCAFALEMNQGWFERNKIKPGDKAIIPQKVVDYLNKQQQ